MFGRASNDSGDVAANRGRVRGERVLVHRIDPPVVSPRAQVLPEHHGDPAWREEQAELIFDDVAPRGPGGDLFLQAVGQFHAPEVPPHLAVVALSGDIVQKQEIAHPFEMKAHAPVVFVDVRPVKALVRKEREQFGDAVLNEVDRRRLERFEEARRKADGHHVLVPERTAPPRGEEELLGLGQQGPFEVLEQLAFGLVVGNEVAAIDLSVADAVLKRNAPLPAPGSRRGARERRERAAGFARHRNRPVARQPLAPVVIARLERLLDEQAAKSGAVDEQVGARDFAGIERDGVDETRLGVEVGADDLPFGPDDAVRFRIAPEEAGVERRVELIGITERRFDLGEIGRRMAEPTVLGRHDRERVFVEPRRISEALQPEPEVVEGYLVDDGAEVAERMDVAVAYPPPIAKLDAQLERRLGRLHQFGLADVQRGVEGADMRERRLTDTDDADLFGFDEPNRNGKALELVGKRRGRHPTGRAAPDHDHAADRGIATFLFADVCPVHHIPLPFHLAAHGSSCQGRSERITIGPEDKKPAKIGSANMGRKRRGQVCVCASFE